MTFFIGALLGFVVGLFYSKGREDPAGDAADAAAQGIRKLYGTMVEAFRGNKGEKKEPLDPEKS